MSESELLAKSTGYIDYPDLKGYFSLFVANALVATGHWSFHDAHPWGYIMRRR